jgi:hypothetical protein
MQRIPHATPPLLGRLAGAALGLNNLNKARLCSSNTLFPLLARVLPKAYCTRVRRPVGGRRQRYFRTDGVAVGGR